MSKLEKITIRTEWEEDTCLYCGMLIYKGETAFYDDESDSIFCSEKCYNDYVEFEKKEK